jgi:hypothetical protein
MILFVDDNAGVLFIKSFFEEVWREIKNLVSTVTKVLNIDSKIH